MDAARVITGRTPIPSLPSAAIAAARSIFDLPPSY
jgi:hypothetical protein